jgi:hypothetical protein
MAAGLMDPGILPTATESLSKVPARDIARQLSYYGQHFVPDKVKTNTFRSRPVKEKRSRCVNDVLAQFVPRVALSENVLRQAFRAITAVGILHGLKHQFGHLPS